MKKKNFKRIRLKEFLDVLKLLVRSSVNWEVVVWASRQDLWGTSKNKSIWHYCHTSVSTFFSCKTRLFDENDHRSPPQRWPQIEGERRFFLAHSFFLCHWEQSLGLDSLYPSWCIIEVSYEKRPKLVCYGMFCSHGLNIWTQPLQTDKTCHCTLILASWQTF